MVDDLVDLVGPAVVAHELGRVRVDDVGVGREHVADERTEVAQLRVRPLEVVRRTPVSHEGLQVGVEVVPVVADRPLERS